MSTKLLEKVYSCLNFVQFVILPGTCIACKQTSYLRRDLCLACETLLPLISHPCLSCALPLPASYTTGDHCGACLAKAPPFHFSISAFDYQPPLKQLISEFKYQGKLCNGRTLGMLLSQKLKPFYKNRELPQIIIPMPLHKKRLRERGFNQASVLSRILAKSMKIPINNTLCHRLKNSHAQMGLSAKERQQNLKNAFALNSTEDITTLNRVAIVDDVVTTMSTVSELSKILLQNGVQEIHIWSIARTCK